MIDTSDPVDFLIGEFTMDTVNQIAHLAGVDEEGFSSPVTNQRQTGICVVLEELTLHGDHAVHQVRLDYVPANLALA